MRILTLSRECTLDDEGLGTPVHALATELRRLGHEVAVLPGDVTAADPYAQPTGALFTGRWPPDLVHALDMRIGPTAVRLADAAGVPLVVSVPAADEHTGSSGAVDPMRRALAHRADLLIACSYAERQQIAAAYRLDPAAIEVLPDGVDVRVWHKMPVASEWARQLYNPDNSPLLLTFDTLEQTTGVRDLLSALPLIRNAHPGTRLVVAGDGSYREILSEQVRRSGLAAVTTFVGDLNLPDLRAAIGAADVIVLPGSPDPAGSAALWAAAVGTPLVAARSGALAEVVVDGRTGRLFGPGSVTELSDAVCAELDDPALAEEHAKAARARLEAEFSWRAVAERAAGLYRATLRRNRTTP
ncbi:MULTISPECIES: glycosyltransferase family 4 protein [unclassified Nocardia]|uniref:glycosyltransferase family 4 protein n=1 Tax=unclassified Nocardia TaxID=2637762 RepID=UPI001CE3DC2C|nr:MULTISPECIES: glycosyltransferase family 4 protein [unclassified Nocardia]